LTAILAWAFRPGRSPIGHSGVLEHSGLDIIQVVPDIWTA